MIREVVKKTKAAKEEWAEEQCENIEKGVMSGNSKEVNNTLKTLANIQQHHVSSHRRQRWKHPDGKHSCSKPVD